MIKRKPLSAPFGHLVALDVEATCSEGGAMPRREMETIEIGAVVVDSEGVLVDEFQTFVRPIRHPRLTPFCIRLTSIRQVDVDGAPSFYEAMEAFKAWFAKYPVLSYGAPGAITTRSNWSRTAA